MVPPADNPAHLSVTRAFVVQFRADTAVEQGHLTGRVEHVISGQATDFESLQTLLAFVAQVLRLSVSAPPSDTQAQETPGGNTSSSRT